MQDQSSSLFRLNGVKQSFKVGDQVVKVLDEATFSIDEASFNIIYGPSGSGKSTILNILSAIQPPSSGIVQYKGKDIYSFSSEQLAFFRANEVGIVYQSNYWIKSLSVIENVAIPLLFSGLTMQEAKKQAFQKLELVGMADFKSKIPQLLSGGEQQRVALARAMVGEPNFIIADEPTGSLDSKNGDDIMSLLKSLNEDEHKTIILVTHNMEYLPYADQLINVADGRCTISSGKDVRTSTDNLLKEMRSRIIRLTKERHVYWR